MYQLVQMREREQLTVQKLWIRCGPKIRNCAFCTLSADLMTDLGWQAGYKAQELVVVRGDSYACQVLKFFFPFLSFLPSFSLGLSHFNKVHHTNYHEKSQANHMTLHTPDPGSLENGAPAYVTVRRQNISNKQGKRISR